MLAALRGAQSILLAGHERPDGDCLGAQAALRSVLTAMGKRVTILNPDPPAPDLDFLSEDCTFGHWQGGDLPEHDLLVVLAMDMSGSRTLARIISTRASFMRPFWQSLTQGKCRPS